MKNKFILLVVFAIVLGIASTIYFIGDNSSKILELTYQTNGGVPYEWKYEIEDEGIVDYVKSYVVEDKNKNGVVGAPISTNYVFKGLKKGRTTITFKYISIVDGSVAKEEKTTVKVDKNKNISIVME